MPEDSSDSDQRPRFVLPRNSRLTPSAKPARPLSVRNICHASTPFTHSMTTKADAQRRYRQQCVLANGPDADVRRHRDDIAHDLLLVDLLKCQKCHDTLVAKFLPSLHCELSGLLRNSSLGPWPLASWEIRVLSIRIANTGTGIQRYAPSHLKVSRRSKTRETRTTATQHKIHNRQWSTAQLETFPAHYFQHRWSSAPRLLVSNFQSKPVSVSASNANQRKCTITFSIGTLHLPLQQPKPD